LITRPQLLVPLPGAAHTLGSRGPGVRVPVPIKVRPPKLHAPRLRRRKLLARALAANKRLIKCDRSIMPSFNLVMLLFYIVFLNIF